MGMPTGVQDRSRWSQVPNLMVFISAIQTAAPLSVRPESDGLGDQRLPVVSGPTCLTYSHPLRVGKP